jgi:hypothetical protein
MLIYVLTTFATNAIWEVVQLPLYTIWSTETPRAIIFAVIHCTGGDFMIATLSFVAAVLLLGGKAWPNGKFIPVLIATLTIGLTYTIYSEWLNTVIRQTWAYSDLMPKLLIIGTGLSPLLQWIVVPSLGFAAISYFLRTSPSPN